MIFVGILKEERSILNPAILLVIISSIKQFKSKLYRSTTDVIFKLNLRVSFHRLLFPFTINKSATKMLFHSSTQWHYWNLKLASEKMLLRVAVDTEDSETTLFKSFNQKNR